MCRRPPARVLASSIRHRRAAIALGVTPELGAKPADNREEILNRARELLTDTEYWLPLLGRLVLENTIADLLQPSTEPADN